MEGEGERESGEGESVEGREGEGGEKRGGGGTSFWPQPSLA